MSPSVSACRTGALIRTLEVRLLMRTFSEAFCVEPPKLKGLSADQSLRMFLEFTAACMEIAQGDERLAHYLRTRLGAGARLLGKRVRTLCPLPTTKRFALARWLYRGIGIELSGTPPESLRFGPCVFASRYTAGDCWFMSAFDEGFLRGLWSLDEADLVFSCRLTQGANCCRAHFSAALGKGGGPWDFTQARLS